MTDYEFEQYLRTRMHISAAELDRTARPPLPLQTLLFQAPLDGSSRRSSLRLVRSMAGAGVLAMAVASGALWLGSQSGMGPLSSVTPSSLPSVTSPLPSLVSSPPSAQRSSSLPLASTSARVSGTR